MKLTRSAYARVEVTILYAWAVLYVQIYTSQTSADYVKRQLVLSVHDIHKTNGKPSFIRSINVSLPQKTRNNGSLFAHVFIYPVGKTPFENFFTSHASAPLTKYAIPQAQSINLLSSDHKKQVCMEIQLMLGQCIQIRS